LETVRDQQVGSESKTRFVEQTNAYLRAGDYSRALDSLRSAASLFPNDADLAELEKRAHDGVQRKAEADRLITESQELFAQRKSAEAIQVLRKAYELDKTNSLARAILANSLVEHAQSLVESDWLKAETLTNQALALNPAHPTAKTILNLIVRKKETSSIEDWVSQASKLQSSGDLFAALAWVAEGLAVHPHNAKLLQIQDAIQRDQDARRRQARRGDLDELRRMQREIEGATDVTAKQELAARIQGVAAKHWTDGEILSIANALLLRLGLTQENSGTSQRGKSATLILHVPRPTGPKPASTETSSISRSPVQQSQIPPQAQTSQVQSTEIQPTQVAPTKPERTKTEPTKTEPTQTEPTKIQAAEVDSVQAASPRAVAPSEIELIPALPDQTVPSQAAPIPAATEEAPATVAPSNEIPTPRTPPSKVPPSKIPPSKVPLRTPVRGKPRSSKAKPAPTPAPVLTVEPAAPVVKVASRPSRPKQGAKSNSVPLILVASAAAIILVAAIFFFAQKHPAAPVAQTPPAVPAVAEPAASTTDSAPEATAAAPTTAEPSQPSAPVSSDSAAANIARPADQPAAVPAPNVGALVVFTGQDGARISLNGKLLRQLTQAGQLRLPNLEPKDYVVQVSKNGFQDPPQQTIRIRKDEEAKLIFNLKPQPSLASLTIQGGAPGTAVLVDQAPVGTIQPDGTLSVSTINPGDHTVELRKDRFKPRQLKKHFVAGATIALAAGDAALEAAPGELKITYSPADAKVAVVKGELLTVVNSGVPLNLAAGTYTLTARTADRFTRTSTIEVAAGQSKSLDLSLAPNGMSKWDDPGAWKQDKDAFIRKGGEYVLYGAAPTSGTFIFSAMVVKGHLLQWVFNYTDSRNYMLLQMDENYFYRAVIHNGQKTDEIRVTDRGDKKSFRMLHIRVSPTEIVHEIKHGNSWTTLDHWTQPGTNLSSGKFGFYIPGDDQVALSGLAHYADLTIH
jgi:tetratricopeptide (TPR) repeat protein